MFFGKLVNHDQMKKFKESNVDHTENFDSRKCIIDSFLPKSQVKCTTNT